MSQTIAAAAAEIHLSAADLCRSFTIGSRKIDVLRSVSLDVRRGESVFLVGASGAGKTTLLYTLAGLERPESGAVTFEGQRLYGEQAWKRHFRAGSPARWASSAWSLLSGGIAREEARLRNERMGFVFQGYFLLPELTALENVMLPALIAGKAKREAAAASLERVGLGSRLHHLPAELSGGEQQRVAIARALVNNPSIIFADEPTGNLDSKTGESIVDLLLALVGENQKTLLVVTHDARLADRGDRKVEIADGQLKTGESAP